jgi:hypothetical protein
MKYAATLVLVLIFFAQASSNAQDRAAVISVVGLLGNPEKFDAKLVMVQGFLQIEDQPRHRLQTSLYLHEEDAKNLLGSNAILVIPSEQMLRDKEKIDRMYVILTGTVHVVRATNDAETVVLKEIRNCRVWSNPNRPIGLSTKDDPSERSK